MSIWASSPLAVSPSSARWCACRRSIERRGPLWSVLGVAVVRRIRTPSYLSEGDDAESNRGEALLPLVCIPFAELTSATPTAGRKEEAMCTNTSILNDLIETSRDGHGLRSSFRSSPVLEPEDFNEYSLQRSKCAGKFQALAIR